MMSMMLLLLMVLMKGVAESDIEVMMINVRWRYSLRRAQVDCTRGGVGVSRWRRNGEMMRMLMVMRVVVMLGRVGCGGRGCCS